MIIINKSKDINTDIGARIKEIRQKRNISQDTFAELINICNGSHISNIERGLSGISVAKLTDICNVLDISADYLLFGNTNKNVETSLHNYLQQLTEEQAGYLMDISTTYVKSCGIKTE